MARNIKLTVEYDGTRFCGWQKQPDQRTVQGDLEQALATVVRHPVTLFAAGRTDSGVHALGQVVNFRTTSELGLERIVRGANALTGTDIAVTEAAEAGPDFHARHSARGRHYVYFLMRGPSALWAGRAVRPRRFPEIEPMNRAAAHLVGEHDFAAFSCRTPDEEGTRSHVFYAGWEPWERGLAFRIGAVRFLYRMVRCIVGRCLEIGGGGEDPDTFAAALRSPERRGERVAPASGLYLVSVDYAEGPQAPAWGPDCLPPRPVV